MEQTWEVKSSSTCSLRGMLLRGNEARDVSDVHHEDGTNLIRDGAEPRKIESASVGRGTTENHGRAEEQRLFPQLLVFDDARLGVHTVRERLEVEELSVSIQHCCSEMRAVCLHTTLLL